MARQYYIGLEDRGNETIYASGGERWPNNIIIIGLGDRGSRF